MQVASTTQSKAGHHFWVVAVPRKVAQNGSETLYAKTAQYLNNKITELDHPKTFRHGTMDELYGLSDDLGKMDLFVETVVAKIAKQLKDLSAESGRDDKKLNLYVGATTLQSWLRDFEWNSAKYRTNSSLRDIAETITQETTQIDEELRDFQSKYSNVTHAIETSERGKSGSLQVRDLSNFIKHKHITESEHLTTLFVVVSKHYERDWDTSYESLSEFVVPRSSEIITSDADNTLRSVVLFKVKAEDFKAGAAKKKFIVREFTYNPEAADKQSETINEQISQKNEIQNELTRWCKQSFGDIFAGWVHLKIIRLFVESVLRFSLPREYIFLLLEPDMKKEKKLREELQRIYGFLGSEHLAGDTGDVSVAGLQEEFFPYVFASIDV